MDEVVKSIPNRETAVIEVDFNEDVGEGNRQMVRFGEC